MIQHGIQNNACSPVCDTWITIVEDVAADVKVDSKVERVMIGGGDVSTDRYRRKSRSWCVKNIS